MSKPRTIELDWLSPTQLPTPSPGTEYELQAGGQAVYVLEGPYACRAVHPGAKTVIRGGATAAVAHAGATAVLGPERPNTKED